MKFTSWGSHGSVEGLQTAVDFASVGHTAEVPVHCSAKSQTPVEFLHTTELLSNLQPKQQSPEILFPSSHCSAEALTPSPQIPTQKMSWPIHCPATVQELVLVQVLRSSHAVPWGYKTSAGQLLDEPSQSSNQDLIRKILKRNVPGASQAEADDLQTVFAGAFASNGQSLAVPVQNSAGSQLPEEFLQVTTPERKASVGQADCVPEQYSQDLN